MKTIAEIKTIDIQTLVWFDKTYGNSYFAQEITLNYGMEDEERFVNPFQYGYSSFEYEGIQFLKKKGFELPTGFCSYDAKQIGIIIRSNTRQNCLKRELKNI